MSRKQFTNQENEFISFIQRCDNVNRKDAEQSYMNYLHKSEPVRKKIREAIIDKVTKESKERVIKLQMEQQAIMQQQYKVTSEKKPKGQKETPKEKQYIQERFEPIKGTNRRYWDFEKGEDISRRERDKRVKEIRKHG